jgi:PTS system nitrogen regulatory IIA component
MQLSVTEASELLGMSEDAIYDLIKKGRLPALRSNRAYHIQKAALLEWAIANGHTIAPDLFANRFQSPTERLPNLHEAMAESRIYYGLQGSDPRSVIESIIQPIPEIAPGERPHVVAAIMSRELLGSTAIGNGIAIPHVRNPIVLDLDQPIVALSFLDTPIDFGALDDQKVGIFFTMLTTTTRIHLHLLARLSFALRHPHVLSALNQRETPQKIIAAIRSVELNIKPIAPMGAGA